MTTLPASRSLCTPSLPVAAPRVWGPSWLHGGQRQALRGGDPVTPWWEAWTHSSVCLPGTKSVCRSKPSRDDVRRDGAIASPWPWEVDGLCRGVSIVHSRLSSITKGSMWQFRDLYPKTAETATPLACLAVSWVVGISP